MAADSKSCQVQISQFHFAVSSSASNMRRVPSYRGQSWQLTVSNALQILLRIAFQSSLVISRQVDYSLPSNVSLVFNMSSVSNFRSPSSPLRPRNINCHFLIQNIRTFFICIFSKSLSLLTSFRESHLCFLKTALNSRRIKHYALLFSRFLTT